MTSFAYDAEVAGLGYRLSHTTYGFKLTVSGYDHKLHVLFRKIIER